MSSRTTTTTEYSEWDGTKWVPKSKEVKEEIHEDSDGLLSRLFGTPEQPYPTKRDLQPLTVPSWPQRGTFPYQAPIVSHQAILDCSSREVPMSTEDY